MGDLGRVECTAGCGYSTDELLLGWGEAVMFEARRCTACDALSAVIGCRITAARCERTSGHSLSQAGLRTRAGPMHLEQARLP